MAKAIIGLIFLVVVILGVSGFEPRRPEYVYAGGWELENLHICGYLLPLPVAVAPNGDVYVGDRLNGRVQYYDAAGSFLGAWGPPVHILNGIAFAGTVLGKEVEDEREERYVASTNDVAVAGDGTVYVADFNRVARFTATGYLLGVWGREGGGNGEFDHPEGIATGAGGSVYVADSGNDRVQYFSPTGAFLGKWGSEGIGPGQFGRPADVTVAPDGNVYVLDSEREAVQYFTATGSFLGGWGLPLGDSRGFPGAIAVGPDGTVFVADSGRGYVRIFSPTGSYRGKCGEAGSGGGRLEDPAGVAVGPSGTVYVTDYGTARLEYYDPRLPGGLAGRVGWLGVTMAAVAAALFAVWLGLAFREAKRGKA